jgi:hypothetical protein
MQYYPDKIDTTDGFRYPRSGEADDQDQEGAPMDKAQRKAAISEYKKRDDAIGIFAVRCAASGEAWVGPSLNLDTIQNRIWFGLRLGSATNKDMQRAWNYHGGDSFEFEVLERLEPDEPAFVRDSQLKERTAHWRGTLNAADA